MESNSSNPGAPFFPIDSPFIAEALNYTPTTADPLNYTPSTAEPLNYTPFTAGPLSCTSFPSEGAGPMCLKDDESETIIDYPYGHPIAPSILQQFEGAAEAALAACSKIWISMMKGIALSAEVHQFANVMRNAKLRVTYKPKVSSADAGADQEKAESKCAEEKKEDNSHEDKSASKTGDKPDSTLVEKPDSKPELKPAEAPPEKPKDQSNSTSGEAKQEEHKGTEPDSNDCCVKSYTHKRKETKTQEGSEPYAYYDKSDLPTIGHGHLMVDKFGHENPGSKQKIAKVGGNWD